MKNILEYLELTAEKYPWRTAVEDPKGSLTWGELEDLSKRIGTAAGKKIDLGDPVMILAPKSPLGLAAMFGAVYGEDSMSMQIRSFPLNVFGKSSGSFSQSWS